MNSLLTPATARFLSGFFTNLAATWFILTVITPNFFSLDTPQALIRLTGNITSFMLTAWLAIKFEGLSKNE